MLDEESKVEGEVVAVKKALCILLAAIFVCCVYVHGSNKRFSLEAMITNLTNFEDMPSFMDITDCWTKDKYHHWDEDKGYGYDVSYDWTFEDGDPLEFLNPVASFFKRLKRSIDILVDILTCVFDNVQYFLPWNNTVPKEV